MNKLKRRKCVSLTVLAVFFSVCFCGYANYSIARARPRTRPRNWTEKEKYEEFRKDDMYDRQMEEAKQRLEESRQLRKDRYAQDPDFDLEKRVIALEKAVTRLGNRLRKIEIQIKTTSDLGDEDANSVSLDRQSSEGEKTYSGEEEAEAAARPSELKK